MNEKSKDELQLEKELILTRERGFSIDREERFPSVVPIAAPIMNYSRKVVGSVGVPGFAYRITPERIPLLGEIVKKFAAEISSRLGYNSY